ncbi:MAG TPA: hypothetical protein VMM59_05100 [Thermohalobaculum sp.]|nr:hypothetical protein [Thermohalobaculum sp.]
MCSRVDELEAALTPDERGAIAQLGRVAGRPGLPFDMAERLMSLGLAELSFGGLDLTVAGRQVLEAMRGQ